MRRHRYPVTVTWAGNQGAGTSTYGAYARDHVVSVPGKPDLAASSDPAFRGDPARHNPEELFVAAIAGCHMLWYLHLCADAGVVVTEYRDAAVGEMTEDGADGGRFERVVLHPEVTVVGDVAAAVALHDAAHAKCFIANSVACPILMEPQVRQAPHPFAPGPSTTA